jgi:hypothetical protein
MRILGRTCWLGTRFYILRHLIGGNVTCSTCLDSILSFAIPLLLVIEAMAPLPEFIRGWVGTSASILQLVDGLMSHDYLKRFHPVISSRVLGQVTFLPRHTTVVGGKQVKCPYNCWGRLDVSAPKRREGGGSAIKVTCPGCKHYTTLEINADNADINGDNDSRYDCFKGSKVVQTSFPVSDKKCEWVGRPTQNQMSRPAKRARTCMWPRCQVSPILIGFRMYFLTRLPPAVVTLFHCWCPFLLSRKILGFYCRLLSLGRGLVTEAQLSRECKRPAHESDRADLLYAGGRRNSGEYPTQRLSRMSLMNNRSSN